MNLSVNDNSSDLCVSSYWTPNNLIFVSIIDSVTYWAVVNIYYICTYSLLPSNIIVNYSWNSETEKVDMCKIYID
jgi:hypothetical protein